MIAGFQKLTLLDYPDKLACLVFTQGCNMDCPYCHNSELIPLLKDRGLEDEFFSYLEKRAAMLEAVVVSGGEPTIHKGLKNFIKKIKGYDLLVKLDTNGSNPSLVKELIDENLIDYIAMDIKNSKEKYQVTSGLPLSLMDKLEDTIDLIMASDIDYEFRTTVIKDLHQKEDIEKIARRIKGAKNYYLQNFKMVETVRDKSLGPVSQELLEEFKAVATPYIEHVDIR